MNPVIVLHGGAGRIERRTLARCQALLGAVLECAHELLRNGNSLDAVTVAVAMLEDSGLFNAGRGASLNTDGTAELDASIMEGRDQRAGAVAAVTRIRNPVLAARAVMEHSKHVLLVGKGAEGFCRSRKVSVVTSNYYFSKGKSRSGTVGAVALDRDGNLAAATSTGGYWGKLPGRVGDSPLIGAGTWADDATVAVSCTGHGESIIRSALAHEVDALLRHRGLDLEEACDVAIEELGGWGEDGGLIAVSSHGEVAATFNSPGMTRGWRVGDGPVFTAVAPGEGG
jgi:beta-aspartyl-peptidase (threonine type)